MAKHRTTLFAVVLAATIGCALIPSAAASAASRARVGVSLASCTTGSDAKARAATFVATVSRRPKTAQMAVRFSLKRRTGEPSDTTGAPASVSAPSWSRWTRSRKGSKSAFVVTRRIDGLTGPGEWYVDVETRWYDKRGKVIGKNTVSSKPCAQPDYSPDLLISFATLGQAQSGYFVSIMVVNQGLTVSQTSAVTVHIDGQQVFRQDLPALAPGAQQFIGFQLGACPSGKPLVIAVGQPANAPELTLSNNYDSSLTCA